MTGHLCLKWNNHSSAFLRSISNIQAKERFCDATIACQGKYFPVHRIILSTCSDYFDEIFDRMECQHPYIIFKDIEPVEMELLLNYMYQGEINVVQEKLPSLIKTAEALRVKGLAVPDDMEKEPYREKRKRSSSEDHPHSKRRLEEQRAKDKKTQSKGDVKEIEHATKSNVTDESCTDGLLQNEIASLDHIKQEPVDELLLDGSLPTSMSNFSKSPSENLANNGTENVFVNFEALEESSVNVKVEEMSSDALFQGEQQCPDTWLSTTAIEPLPTTGSTLLERIHEERKRIEETSDPETLLPDQIRSISNCEATGQRLSTRTSVRNLYNCTYCNYSSPVKNNVNRHVLFRHTKEKHFKCYFCPNSFSNKTNLQRHMMIHTGEKPFQCKRCGLKYRHSNSLKNHLLRNVCTFMSMEA